MTPKELELHRELLVIFKDYIKHNLKWEEKSRDVDALKAKKALRQLIDVAYLRWKELHNSRKKFKEKKELVIGDEFFREVVKKHNKIKNNKGTDD